jgi:quinol monooxygenase YgiN
MEIIKSDALLIMLTLVLVTLCTNTFAQGNNAVIRIAKLRIDSAQLESYKVALKEEIDAAVRVEPGVLTLYSVAEKENPSSITIFEIYANPDAYKAHLETPHFKKYKTATKTMVKSLELVDAVPIDLQAKSKL